MTYSDDCIFCKIIKGDIPSKVVYEDEYVFAFFDINPQAPVHVVIVPKNHIKSAAEISGSNSVYVAKCFEAVPQIARKLGLDNGFRIVNNCGADGGQTINHIHFHLLGGKFLGEKIV